MKSITDKRLKIIDYNPIFDEKTDPLTWMERWLCNDSVEMLPQETEITPYLVGRIDLTIDDKDFTM